MEQITLNLSDNVQRAMEQAFNEAQQYLDAQGGFQPFTVTVVDEGLEVNAHEGDTPDAIRESVKGLLAVDMPEGYALAYDGFIDTDEGTLDAVIVEVADRGATKADALAMIYTKDADGNYTFEPTYGYIGTEAQLYPAGTKPIVSGLAALDEDVEDASEDEPQQAAEDGCACESEPGADAQAFECEKAAEPCGEPESRDEVETEAGAVK